MDNYFPYETQLDDNTPVQYGTLYVLIVESFVSGKQVEEIFACPVQGTIKDLKEFFNQYYKHLNMCAYVAEVRRCDMAGRMIDNKAITHYPDINSIEVH